jgi:hypothetical protein
MLGLNGSQDPTFYRVRWVSVASHQRSIGLRLTPVPRIAFRVVPHCTSRYGSGKWDSRLDWKKFKIKSAYRKEIE